MPLSKVWMPTNYPADNHRALNELRTGMARAYVVTIEDKHKAELWRIRVRSFLKSFAKYTPKSEEAVFLAAVKVIAGVERTKYGWAVTLRRADWNGGLDDLRDALDNSTQN